MCKASCSKIIESLYFKRGARKHRRVSARASGNPHSCCPCHWHRWHHWPARASPVASRPWLGGVAPALPCPTVVPGPVAVDSWDFASGLAVRGGHERPAFPVCCPAFPVCCPPRRQVLLEAVLQKWTGRAGL